MLRSPPTLRDAVVNDLASVDETRVLPGKCKSWIHSDVTEGQAPIKSVES